MLILRIGWDCRSEYEWAQHVGSVGRARDHGLEPIWIAQGPDAPGWDPFERAILRAVDELFRDTVISDRTWAALAERYDTELLMSAVFTASSYRATSMALNAFGVQLEPGNERFPQLSDDRSKLRGEPPCVTTALAVACVVGLLASAEAQTHRRPRREPSSGRRGAIRTCKVSGPAPR